jgi:hypothetical protein
MAKITGANSDICVAVSATFGSAALVGAGSKMLVNSLDLGRSVTKLRANPIGSGKYMDGSDTQQGAISDAPQINKDLQYNDPGMILLAQMFGTANVADAGDGAYTHSILFNESANAKFCTVAAKGTTTEVFEFPSCSVRAASLNTSNFPGPVTAAFDMLANNRVIASTVNEVATLEAATVANAKRIIADAEDMFVFNAQAGDALDSGDKKAVTSVAINYNRQQEHVHEMRGAAGRGVPVESGDPPFAATVTITLSSLEDFTFFTAAGAGTAYKGGVLIEDSQAIGGTKKYYAHFYFPYLKVIDDPQYTFSSPGQNQHQVTFECLQAASNPTGMIDVHPYVIVQNNRSTAFLA